MFDENTIKLLNKWTTGGESGLSAALRLSRDLIFFRPDPQQKEKVARRNKDPNDWMTSLEPRPLFQDWEYAAILKRGVRPLAQTAPLPTASLLIEAATQMIALETGRDPDAHDVARYDASEVWSPRLDGPTRPYSNSNDELIRTLAFACEQVYVRGDTSDIAQLDRQLRSAKWYLFDRVRYHLYAIHLDRAEEWIREEILNYGRYAEDTYGFEFQRMVRIAAEHFGEKLISTTDMQHVLRTIETAPDKEDYRQFMAEQFTEEGYRRRQDYFQLRQLRPFASLLVGKHAERYGVLVAAGRELTDEDFIRYGVSESKTGVSRSPKGVHELAGLSDDELVAFLNDWEEVGRDPEQWWVEIDFSGLATAFRQLIIDNPARFLQWKDRWRTLQRPIFVRYALEAAGKRIPEHTAELPVWLDVADWAMSRTDSEREGESKPSEVSREQPNWDSTRRQVVDLIAVSISKETNVSLEWRTRIFALLAAACVAPDYYLDGDRAIVTPREYLTDAINTTRGRALENLIRYGYWVRRNAAELDVADVFRILASRLANRPALAIAEHALLGASFHQLYDLSASGASDAAPKVFPQERGDKWASAFAAYLKFNDAHPFVFDMFRPQLEFALENLHLLHEEANPRNDSIANLGQHLLTYFMLDLIDLDSADSLLRRFYVKTKPGTGPACSITLADS